MTRYNDLTWFGQQVRSQFPDLIDSAFGGDVQQVSDVEMLYWEGQEYVWEIELDNGAKFQITMRQTSRAEEESSVEELLSMNPEHARDPQEAEEVQTVLAELVEFYATLRHDAPERPAVEQDIHDHAEILHDLFTVA